MQSPSKLAVAVHSDQQRSSMWRYKRKHTKSPAEGQTIYMEEKEMTAEGCLHVYACMQAWVFTPVWMHVPRGQSSHLYLMTLISLGQPIRELGVSGRPALTTRYLPNMCCSLLPSPINSPSMEGWREEAKALEVKKNNPFYNCWGVGGINGAYRRRERGKGPKANVLTHVYDLLLVVHMQSISGRWN